MWFSPEKSWTLLSTAGKPVVMNKTFPASLSHLYEMLHFIKEKASQAGLGASLQSKIELACEEALVNIISYGYPIRRGDITIATSFENGRDFKIIITDQGIPYNPISNVKKGNSAGVGGYGIFLLSNLVDQIDYKRQDNSNILTLLVHPK